MTRLDMARLDRIKLNSVRPESDYADKPCLTVSPNNRFRGQSRHRQRRTLVNSSLSEKIRDAGGKAHNREQQCESHEGHATSEHLRLRDDYETAEGLSTHTVRPGARPSSTLMEGIKEDLFKLEVGRKQGLISQAEYDKNRLLIGGFSVRSSARCREPRGCRGLLQSDLSFRPVALGLRIDTCELAAALGAVRQTGSVPASTERFYE